MWITQLSQIYEWPLIPLSSLFVPIFQQEPLIPPNNSASPVFCVSTITTLGQAIIISLPGNNHDLQTGHGYPPTQALSHLLTSSVHGSVPKDLEGKYKESGSYSQ